MTTSAQQPTRTQRFLFIVFSLLATLVLWAWYQSLLNEHADDIALAPDFAAIEDSDSRKQSFINYLYPLVVEENNRILQQRAQLLAVEQYLHEHEQLGIEQELWLERLSDHYAVKFNKSDMQSSVRVLLRRINVIPASLALAQAANETAWGTSRFATDANNYFGQWCYREGCGLVPVDRDAGLNHEVKSFHSVADSVKSYMHTLNSGRAYANLRNLRQKLQDQQQPLTGYELAEGLSKYSERGTAYVVSIRGLIATNNLSALTDALYVSLEEDRADKAF